MRANEVPEGPGGGGKDRLPEPAGREEPVPRLVSVTGDSNAGVTTLRYNVSMDKSDRPILDGFGKALVEQVRDATRFALQDLVSGTSADEELTGAEMTPMTSR